MYVYICVLYAYNMKMHTYTYKMCIYEKHIKRDRGVCVCLCVLVKCPDIHGKFMETEVCYLSRPGTLELMGTD